jgi:hypothetical protein
MLPNAMSMPVSQKKKTSNRHQEIATIKKKMADEQDEQEGNMSM